MQTAESGIAFIMNFFLGRLPRPELAIAAFGVLDGLIRVLLSPLRNLIHTTQALVKNRADARSGNHFLAPRPFSSALSCFASTSPSFAISCCTT